MQGEPEDVAAARPDRAGQRGGKLQLGGRARVSSGDARELSSRLGVHHLHPVAAEQRDATVAPGQQVPLAEVADDDIAVVEHRDGPGQVDRHRDPLPPGGGGPGREIGDGGRFARVDARHDESGELSGGVSGVLGPRADHRAGRVGAVGGRIGDHRFDPSLEVRSSLQGRRQVLLERQIRPSRDDGVDHCVPVLVELVSDLVCLAGAPTDERRHCRPLPVAPRPAVTVTVLFVGSPPDPSGKPRSADRAGTLDASLKQR